jgi:hypothetical protein
MLITCAPLHPVVEPAIRCGQLSHVICRLQRLGQVRRQSLTRSKCTAAYSHKLSGVDITSAWFISHAFFVGEDTCIFYGSQRTWVGSTAEQCPPG